MAGKHSQISDWTVGSKKHTARRIVVFLRPDGFHMFGVLLILIISSGAMTITPLALGRFVDSLTEIEKLLDAKVEMMLVVGVLSVSPLIAIIAQYMSVWLGQRQVLRVRTRLSSLLLDAPFSILGRANVGQVSANFSNDVIVAQSLSGSVLQTSASTISTVVFSGLAVASITPWAACLAFGVFPVMIFASEVIGRKISTITKHAMTINGNVLQSCREMSDHATALMIRGVLDRDLIGQRIETTMETAFSANLHAERIQSAYKLVVGLSSGFLISVTYFIGGAQVVSGSITIGQLTALITLMTAMYSSMQQLAGIRASFAAAIAAFSRIFDTADTLLEPCDQLEEHRSKRMKVRRLSGAAEMKLTEYSVGHNGIPMIKPISFKIKQGEIFTIFGRSGLGKTTLLLAIAGIISPTSGVAALFRDRRERWQREVTLVSQEAVFLSGSIADNFRLVHPKVSDDEIWHALEVVGLREDLEKLPEGLDTDVGHQGSRFSGGQRARLSIARGIIVKSPVLLLDEPLAHLDERSQHIIVEALRNHCSDRIIITVSHQDYLVEASDSIVSLSGVS